MKKTEALNSPCGADQIPTVSVVVPCYRVTAFVSDALESLRAQTFRDFEVIVVNDGCPDSENLERALAPFRTEIVYVKQDNKGLGGARNKGINSARAPLIALLDPDDVWEVSYLEEQIRILRERPEIDVVFSNASFFGDSPLAGKTFMEVFPSRGEVTFLSLASGQCSVFGGVTARKGAIVRAGLFDEGLGSAEDLDLWLRMLHGGSRFTYHDLPLVRYRLRGGSLSDDRRRLARIALQVYAKLFNSLELNGEERHALLAAMRRASAMVDLMGAKQALFVENRGAALRRFARANEVLRSARLSVGIWLLKLWPELVYAYVHRRFQTMEAYLH
jgi:glycosyltransferase involved in cell wall biosynthesis